MTDPFRLGPALAFDVHDPTTPPTGEWRLLTARITAEALRQRVEHVRHTLSSPDRREVDARVAASTEQFGLAARLLAAHICATALGRHLDLHTSSIRWLMDTRSGLQLSFAATPHPVNPLQDSAIAELTDRVQALYGVSPHVLWGNIGSAANSTIALLRASRPELVDAARAAADQLLTDPRIDGGAQRVDRDYRRTSCCLIYRATDGLCGDCVLHRRGIPRV